MIKLKSKILAIISVLFACTTIHAEPQVYISGTASSQEAKAYADTNKISTRYLIYRDIKPWLNKAPGKNALDYGSGLGYSSKFLMDNGFTVTGVDINKHMLEQAKYPAKKILLARNDALPFANETFDLVFSSLVLFELDNLESIVQYLSQAKRVLKDNGYFIGITGSTHMYDPQCKSQLRNSNYPENYNAKSGDLVKTTSLEKDLTFADYFWTEEDYRQAFAKAGLKVCAVHYPLGKKEEPYPWQDELYNSPVVLFLAAKHCP